MLNCSQLQSIAKDRQYCSDRSKFINSNGTKWQLTEFQQNLEQPQQNLYQRQ